MMPTHAPLHAETATGIHPLLQARMSPRGFSMAPLPDGALRLLLEAARSAPSSHNEQPWRFVVATRDDPEAYARLFEALAPKNREWAGSAPVLIAALAKLRFTKNDRENRHAFYDVGQAVAALTFQASALGLFVHQMAGFDKERLRASLDVPEGFEPATAIAVGALDGDADELRRERPRQRLPVEEIAFRGRFGEPLA